MATYYMYFPFLTCEVKCVAAALDIADRQNAHSMTLAVRGIVELLRAVKREDEVNWKILAFSVSRLPVGTDLRPLLQLSACSAKTWERVVGIRAARYAIMIDPADTKTMLGRGFSSRARLKKEFQEPLVNVTCFKVRRLGGGVR
ncbi:hypothetical protein VTI74DRAFT_3394 [Chaetomium olivicolor]